MRSARLRFPLSMSLLVKRATFRLLYLASGTSGRRTALLRLGTICLLINQGTCFVLIFKLFSRGCRGTQSSCRGLRGSAPRVPRLLPPLLSRHRFKLFSRGCRGLGYPQATSSPSFS